MLKGKEPCGMILFSAAILEPAPSAFRVSACEMPRSGMPVFQPSAAVAESNERYPVPCFTLSNRQNGIPAHSMRPSPSFAFHSALTARLLPGLASCLVLLLLGATPAALATDEASFFLESVHVVNASSSVGKIVISQSLLKEGARYSEADFQDALARINRLPFVLNARFELAKGSHRGAYSLQITIETMSPLFLQASSNLSLFGEQIQVQRNGKSFFENTAAIGLRGFVGRQGVLFGGVGTADSAFGQIGYTQYGLFGTGGYASADLQYARSGNVLILPFVADPSVSGWEVRDTFSGRLALGVPIGGNHSIRARYIRVQADVRRLEPVFSEPGRAEEIGRGRLSLDQLDLYWLYDTTDEVVFPTRGLFVVAGPGLLKGETPPTFQLVPGPNGSPIDVRTVRDRRETRTVYVSLSATHYLPLTPRHTVLAGLEGYVGPTQVNGQGSDSTFRLAARLGHSAGLWSEERTSRLGDLRLETTVDYSYENAGPARPSTARTTSFYDRFERLRLGSGIVLRNGWALLRVGLTYTVFDRGRR